MEDEGDFSHAIRKRIGDLDPSLTIEKFSISDGALDIKIGYGHRVFGIEAGIGLRVDGADDNRLAGSVLEVEAVENRDNFIDGIGVRLDADLISQVLADSSNGDVLVSGGFVDDLHADAEDGFTLGPHGDIDGLSEVCSEAKSVPFRCHLDGLFGVFALNETSEVDYSCDFIDMDADLLDVGVRVDILVNFHFLSVHLLLQWSSLTQVQHLIVVQQLNCHQAEIVLLPFLRLLGV